MKRYIVCALLTAGLSGAGGSLWAQHQSEKQVSGPDQWDHERSTGKSYKKGTKKRSDKENNPRTGQNRRLGNTGDLTKNGGDVNGKRAEGSSKRKSSSQDSPNNR